MSDSTYFIFMVVAMLLLPIAGRVLRAGVLAPLRLLRRPIRMDFNYDSFDPADLPAHAKAALAQASSQLAGRGYRAIGHVRRREPNAPRDHVSVWQQPDSGRIAAVMLAFNENPKAPVGCAVQIGPDFTDETSLTVSNSPALRVGPLHPGVLTVRLAEIWDITVLDEVARRWDERDRGARVPQWIVQGRAGEYMTKQDRAAAGLAIGRGVLRLEEGGASYRYTLRGACRTLWPQLWPIRPWIERRMRRDAERLVRSLGLGEPRDLIFRQRPRGPVGAGPEVSLRAVNGFPIVVAGGGDQDPAPAVTPPPAPRTGLDTPA